MALRLSDGNRVCIVGGGPAGSLAALHLLDHASRNGLRLKVFIFEPRDFSRPGPAGCNRCAGILSSRALRGLDSLGVALPQSIIQSEVQGYAVNLDGKSLHVQRPDVSHRAVSVYRGGGPRCLDGEPIHGFDAYLLSQACARGARHIPVRVRQVTWDEGPVLHTAQGDYAAHLLVLATGVNSRAPLDPVFGYRPPQTEIMAQDEIVRPPMWPDNQVSIFFRQPPNLIFGALIPKGRYLNISLLGHKLTRDAVQEFIDLQASRTNLPDGSVTLCGCTPRIAVRPSRRYFGTRWVAVGDAAATRLYKDGIGSAFATARSAMQTAVEQGISRRVFENTYAPVCQAVATDNRYGRLLFRMWSLTLRTPSLLRGWMGALQQEDGWPPAQRIHHRILWSMFTGDESYQDLFWLALSPKSLYGLVRAWRRGNDEMIFDIRT